MAHMMADVLQAQITAVSVAGGGCVEIPAATRIVLDQPLALQPNVWLRGAGATSVLAAAPGFPWAALLDTGTGPAGVVRVSDLKVIGGGPRGEPGSGIGIWFQHVAPGSAVQDVIVEQTLRSGICVGSVHSAGPSVGVRIMGNTLLTCGALLATMDKMGVSIINAVDFLVADNVFQDCAVAVNCELHPGASDCLINGVIDRNVIRSSLGEPSCWGISVLGQPGRPAVHIAVTNNHLFGGPGLGPAFLVEQCESYTLRGNRVYRQGG